MKTIRLTFLILLVQFIGMSVAQALDGWEANIRVGIATAENRLSFGQRPDATDGVDGRYDVPAMLNGDIKAYFQNGNGSYWRDIRAFESGKAKEWKIQVESPLNGGMVVIRWESGNIPTATTATLVDNITGIATDMKANNKYSYKNEGQRELLIKVAY